MAELTFRNADEEDVEEIVRMLGDHLLGGGFLQAALGDKNPGAQLRALVEAADTEYGYEQATLAYDGAGLAGLFIGYPRDLLRALGPRTMSVLMRGRSPLSWPGMIREQARLARAEPAFPPDSYILRCLAARDPVIVPQLIAEAVAEAVEEECSTVVANVYEEDGTLERILKAQGFEEGDRRPIADRRLSERLGAKESVQLRLATGYVGSESVAEDA